MNELKQTSNTSVEKNYFQTKTEEYIGDTEKTIRAVKKAFPDLINVMFNPVTIGLFVIFALVKPELLLTCLVIALLFSVAIHCYRHHKSTNEEKHVQST